MNDYYKGTTKYYCDGRVANEEYKKEASECIVHTIKKTQGKVLSTIESVMQGRELEAAKKEIKGAFNIALAYSSGYFGQLPPWDTSETKREAPTQ